MTETLKYYNSFDVASKLKSYKDDNFHYAKLAEEASELATAAIQMLTKPSPEVIKNLIEEIDDLNLRIQVIKQLNSIREVESKLHEENQYFEKRMERKIKNIIKKHEDVDYEINFDIP